MKLALVALFALVAYGQAQRFGFTFGGYNPYGFRSPFFPNPFTIQSVDDVEEPAEDQQPLCTTLPNYKATSFNAIRFTTTTTYRDGKGMRSLFEDADGNLALYDFPVGRFSVMYKGACGYYENENLKLTFADALDRIELNFEVDNFAGTEGQGYTVQNGDVTYRGVVNTQCADVYNYIAINNVPETIIFNTDFDFDFDVTSKFAEADTIFAAYNAANNCTKVDVNIN